LKCRYLSAILYSIVLNNELINLYISGSHSLGATHELTKWDPDVGLQSVMDSQCLKATFVYIYLCISLIEALECEVHLNNVTKFSSYLTENTLSVHYKFHSVIVWEVIIVYFENCGKNSYAEWAKCGIFFFC
jgi:hypothetical protein